MSWITEFKEFAIKGNVVDMAVGIVIGAAFGKIVSSLVSDVITPLLGLVVGGINLSGLQIKVPGPNGDVVLRYGMFCQQVVDFTVVAFALFLLIKAVNRLKRAESAPAAAPKPTVDQELLGEIRDLLKN